MRAGGQEGGRAGEHKGMRAVVGPKPPEAAALMCTCPRCLKLHASAVNDLHGAIAAARNALARGRGLHCGDVLQVLVEDLHAHSEHVPPSVPHAPGGHTKRCDGAPWSCTWQTRGQAACATAAT